MSEVPTSYFAPISVADIDFDDEVVGERSAFVEYLKVVDFNVGAYVVTITVATPYDGEKVLGFDREATVLVRRPLR